MFSNRPDICNSCKQSSCKELKADKTYKNKKVYCPGKMQGSASCPMYVVPVNCGDVQIYNRMTTQTVEATLFTKVTPPVILVRALAMVYSWPKM